MILYTENPKKKSRKIIELINKLKLQEGIPWWSSG